MRISNLKVLVVDDHTLLRKGVKYILKGSPCFADVDEASTGVQTLKKVMKCDYDCVLLDIHLPDRSGIDILKQLKSIRPALPVLVLTMYPEDLYGIRSLRAGAAGYLTKKCPPEELKEAICRVCQGQKYITPCLAEKLAFEFEKSQQNTRRPLHESLSDRELQIMTMIGSGKIVSQIARELWLSVKTISTHRAHILRKMSMTNNAELTHYAITNSLVF